MNMVIWKRSEPGGDFRKKTVSFFWWVEVINILYHSKAVTFAHILVGMTTSLDPYRPFWSLMKSQNPPKVPISRYRKFKKKKTKKIVFFFLSKINIWKCIQTSQKCMRNIQHLRVCPFRSPDIPCKVDDWQKYSNLLNVWEKKKAQISIR